MKSFDDSAFVKYEFNVIPKNVGTIILIYNFPSPHHFSPRSQRIPRTVLLVIFN